MADPTADDAEINRLHREKMERRQAARRKVLATKIEERGLVIVHTGAGKGKSTAAFGMVLRCIGHDTHPIRAQGPDFRGHTAGWTRMATLVAGPSLARVVCSPSSAA